MSSHISSQGKRSISYKSMKVLSSKHNLRIVRLTTIHNRPKWTVSASGGLRLLPMVLEAYIGRCTSEDAGSQERWIVRSHIDWRCERDIPFKGIETLP